MAERSGLCLSRKKDESVILDLREWGLGLFEVLTVETRHDKARSLFCGDKRIPIHRKEVFEKIEGNRGE